MNTWNEDRLREDSEPEDDPSSQPIMTPVFPNPSSPRRRSESVVTGGGGGGDGIDIPTPQALPGLERVRSTAAGNGNGRNPNAVSGAPSAQPESPGTSCSASAGARFGRRRSAGAIAQDRRRASRVDSANLPDDAATAAEAAKVRSRLEREAPIRGLAKQMSRMDMGSGNKKGGVGNGSSNHGRTRSGMSFLMPNANNHSRTSSRGEGFSLSESGPLPSAKPVALPRPTRGAGPAGAARPTTAAAGDASVPAGGEQQQHQASHPDSSSRAGGGVSAEASSATASAAAHLFAASRPGEHRAVFSGAGVQYPETPPPLRGNQGHASLLNHDPLPEDDAKAQIEPELMIGEIQSIRLNDEIVLVRKALVLIVLSLVAAFLVRQFAGEMDKNVKILEVVCFVSIFLLSFPVIRFTARLFAYIVTTRASALLYRGNRYYFVVALHYDIAISIWCVGTVYIWKQLFHEWVYTDESELARGVYRHVDPLLECHLALRVGILVKNFLVLLVATSYLWRSYLQRVQSSILAQYILLLLTDYCTKGFCNPSDQRFAIEMGRQGIDEGKNISLYAVSKAMGFIPRNKLGHAFFRQLAGSDTLDSSKDATTLGNFLFDQLVIRSRPSPVRASSASPQRKSLAATLTAVALNGGAGGGSIRALRSGQGAGVYRALPRFGAPMQKRSSEPSASTAGLGVSSATPGVSPRSRSPAAEMVHRHSDGNATPKASSKFSSALHKLVPASERASSAPSGGGGGGGAKAGSRGETVAASVLSAVRGDGDGQRGGDAPAAAAATVRGRNEVHQVAAGAHDGESCLPVNVDGKQESTGAASHTGERAGCDGGSGGGGGKDGQTSDQPVGLDGGPETRRDRARILAREKSTFTSSSSVASGNTCGDEDSGRDTDGGRDSGSGKSRRKKERKKAEQKGRAGATVEAEKEEPPQELLTRSTLCPVLEPEVQDVVFKIFDIDNSGTVTREEMVLGVVNTFKDHRSLAHTLQDSEHIARKLGLIIMAVILFILFFVWLSIWGADVVSLSVTFASFLIAFSFLIGTSASNLMAAVLFIFVSRLYDVGDRIHIYDGTAPSEVPMNVTVVKVDLMTTVLKRWDEQVFYMPNYLLASKTIVNIQRSAHQWHEFFIQVAASTTSEKLLALQASLQAFSKSKDKPEGLYTRMGYALTGIEDSTKLNIRITFRQRGNWQNMEKKWACQSICTWAIKSACDSLDISYSMPEVPLRVKSKFL